MRKGPSHTTAAAVLLLSVLVPLSTGLAGAQDRPSRAPVTAEDASAGRPGPYGETYVIGVEDLIQVSVWKNPDLTLTVPVRPDGKISLPLIDDVQAAGLSPMELKAILTERWAAFISAPEVSVIVKEINSFKVYLVGEVARPGELKLKDRTTLLQAISLAGGFTAFADQSEVVIFRATGGVEKRFEVNVKKVVSGSRPEENLVLHPGDTIFVP